jgi:hypothetical protein
MAQQVAQAQQDVLVTRDGERLVGEVVSESGSVVVFRSRVGGVISVPKESVATMERHAPLPAATVPAVTVGQSVPPAPAALPSGVVAVPGQPTTRRWVPEEVGKGRFDWIELKSGEWLKGRLKYVQKKVEIESDELEGQEFDFKDVKQIIPADPMYTKVKNGASTYAKVRVEPDGVVVESNPPVRMTRDQLESITRGGSRERDYWSGDLSASLSLQTGNTKQFSSTGQAELIRRSPDTRFDLSYVGNYSVNNGTENARDQRVGGNYDIFLNSDFFIRALNAEYYRDPLSNINHRITAGFGLGYYIFDNDKTEWFVAAGPSYQRVWFASTPEGERNIVDTPGATFQTRLKQSLTRRVDFILEDDFTFTKSESGTFSNHAIATLKFKKALEGLDLKISLIWDRIEDPQQEDGGAVPGRDDFRFTLGLGYSF